MIDNYGVFAYRRSDEEYITSDVFFETEKEAIEYARCLEEEYPKDKYFIQIWLEDKEGYFGNSGEPIWDNY